MRQPPANRARSDSRRVRSRSTPAKTTFADQPQAGRAVIYMRVSSAQQADNDYDPEGFSIPAQREACLRKAAALGVHVVEEFVDRGESATHRQPRPASRRCSRGSKRATSPTSSSTRSTASPATAPTTSRS